MAASQRASARKRQLFLLTGLAAMAAILLLPPPAPMQTPHGPLALSVQGKAALAVLAFAVILWATEALPFAITGLLAKQDPASVTVLDAENKRIRLTRDEIDELHESEVSLMPEKILESLTPQQLRDLFSYLEK